MCLPLVLHKDQNQSILNSDPHPATNFPANKKKNILIHIKNKQARVKYVDSK